MKSLLLTLTAYLVLLPADPLLGQPALLAAANVCPVTFNVPPSWDVQVKDAAGGCAIALRPAEWRKTRSASDTQYLAEWPVAMTVFRGDLTDALKRAGFAEFDAGWGVTAGEGTAYASPEALGVWTGVRAEPNRRYYSKREGYTGQGHDVVIAATGPGGLALAFHFQVLELTSAFNEKAFFASVLPNTPHK